MAASAVVVTTATSTVTARPVPEKLDQASYSSCQIVLQFVQLRLRLLPLTAELHRFPHADGFLTHSDGSLIRGFSYWMIIFQYIYIYN